MGTIGFFLSELCASAVLCVKCLFGFFLSLVSTPDAGLRTPDSLVKLRQLSLTRYDTCRKYPPMTGKHLPRPTAAELELLRVLWQRGPSTVRQIHEALPGHKGTGYTTTLKLLQRMLDKRLLQRDESTRSHVYTAIGKAEETQRQLVRDLLRRAFGGAPAKLVLQALSEENVSTEELSEIRRVLDDLEARQNKKRAK
jgi:BlaI family transcriptional regulator, penicillinase repressor